MSRAEVRAKWGRRCSEVAEKYFGGDGPNRRTHPTSQPRRDRPMTKLPNHVELSVSVRPDWPTFVSELRRIADAIEAQAELTAQNLASVAPDPQDGHTPESDGAVLSSEEQNRFSNDAGEDRR